MQKQEKIIVSIVVIIIVLLIAGGVYFFINSRGESGTEEVDYAKYAEVGLSREQVDKAFGKIKLFEDALIEEPDAYDYILRKAAIYKMLHEYEKAEQDYLYAIEKFPELGAAYAELAEIYVYPFARYEEAEEYYKLAIENASYRSDYYRWLADLYISKFPKKKGEIEDLMLEGSKVTPGNEGPFYSYLVVFFEREGNIDKAIYYARKFLEGDPDNEIMQKTLNSLLSR